MGSDKREAESATLRKPRKRNESTNVADWQGVNPVNLVRLIAVASAKGGALRLGYTRDGGAYAVGVYAGSNYFTDYIRPQEDIDAYILDLLGSFDDYDRAADDQPVRVKKQAK